MKIAMLFLLAAGLMFAQPDQFAGAGMSFNQYAAPQINGLLVYAKRIVGADYPTYSFSAVNILSATRVPFKLMTTTETGIAQSVGQFGPFSVYGVGTAGLSTAGETGGTGTGYVLTGGGLALAPIRGGWRAGPYLRIIKSSLTDRQWAVGLMLGWGK